MKRLDYQITFQTPAFLGNAEQDGQWRTPPFKALLRQWWRIAYAGGSGGQPEISQMRRDEGLLFGVAADGHEGSRKSQVRLRLDRWDMGKQREWGDLGKVAHPEVKFPIDAGLYLAYGPVTLPKGAKKPALKKNAAIQAGEQAMLSIACPDDAAPLIETALGLIDRFGTIGGRSRNGWGSLSLTPTAATTFNHADRQPLELTRDWGQALALDWPHAIGADDHGPLQWQSRQIHQDWRSAMVELARLKIGLRTQFKFTAGKFAKHPEGRHWLSYPVTNHNVQAWGKDARLPNSLRFKLRPDANDELRALIVHLPCRPPDEPFMPKVKELVAVWSKVHAFLDQHPDLQRLPA